MVLGVLVVVMLVLGYFLYDKRKKEKEEAAAPAGGGGDVDRVTNPQIVTPKGNGPKLNPRPAPGLGGVNPNPNPKKGNPGGVAGGGGPGVPFGFGSPAQTPEQIQAQVEKFRARLVGTWVADLGNGVTEELTYTAAGTFTSKLTGPAPAMLSAKYTMKDLVGTKGVKIQLDTGGGTRTVVALFDGDELEHPSLQDGVTGTFRKK